MLFPAWATTAILMNFIFLTLALPSTPNHPQAEDHLPFHPDVCTRLKPPNPWASGQLLPDPPPAPRISGSGFATLTSTRDFSDNGNENENAQSSPSMQVVNPAKLYRE